VGGVVRHQGKYYLYCECPIAGRDQVGVDYGPIALATADAPEGSWTRYEDNPVLPQGEWGSWDDGGFSEAKVTYMKPALLTGPINRTAAILGFFTRLLAPFTWVRALQSLSNKLVDMDSLITHKFSLEDALKGLKTIKNRKGNAVKGLLIP